MAPNPRVTSCNETSPSFFATKLILYLELLVIIPELCNEAGELYFVHEAAWRSNLPYLLGP
jgi:hypothetical protein